MATYKVPQDVEAEDKLIGPFSFRQFIYLIVAAIGCGLAYGLSRIAMWLIILPAPLVLFFLVLALPLKKDQPFEVYLAAMVRFMLKSKMRMWEPEGNVQFVHINTAKPEEEIQLKEFSGDEAAAKLEYLANIVDSGGWATRGLTQPVDFGASSLNDTVLAESSTTQDLMDDTTGVVQSFDSLLERERTERRQEMTNLVQQAITSESVQTPLSSTVTSDFDLPTPIIQSAVQTTPTTTPSLPQIQPQTTVTAPVTIPTVPTQPAVQTTPQPVQQVPAVAPQAVTVPISPSPAPITQTQTLPQQQTPAAPQPLTMQQIPAAPIGLAQDPFAQMPEVQLTIPDMPATIVPTQQAQAPRQDQFTADIMRLANNNDLSISAISREANRIHGLEDGEVVVDLH